MVAMPIRLCLSRILRVSVVPLRLTPTMKMASGSPSRLVARSTGNRV